MGDSGGLNEKREEVGCWLGFRGLVGLTEKKERHGQGNWGGVVGHVMEMVMLMMGLWS